MIGLELGLGACQKAAEPAGEAATAPDTQTGKFERGPDEQSEV